MDVGNAGSIQTEHLSCLGLTVNKEGGGWGGGHNQQLHSNSVISLHLISIPLEQIPLYKQD